MLDVPNGSHTDKNFSVEPAGAALAVPLCVDLDGTLIRTDTLVEGLVAVLTRRHVLSRLPLLLTSNRAMLKRRVAEYAPLDVALLPYNDAVLDYLRAQRAAGRCLVLATAADALVARAIADQLGLFDAVLCSDGVHNLKGDAKALALIQRFGIRGFDYVGNARSDLPIWKAARRAIVVNAPDSVGNTLRGSMPVDAVFDDRVPLVHSIFKAMRPHQWSKNLLVFVPMIMAHAVTNLDAWFHAICIFLSFCATASCIYLVNDIADLTADRQHPRKRSRPLASGRLDLSAGLVLACTLGVAGIGLSLLVHAEFVVVIYAAISIGYSLRLKEFPIVDVFTLAALYTIRMLGGGVATGYEVSLWLLAFSGFLFLALALVKRVGEINFVARSGGTNVAARRGYFPGDIPILQNFGCVSSFASGIVLALFVGSDVALQRYATPKLLWGAVPLILFWQCRLWLSTTRGHMHDDPIIYAMRDWVSWVVLGGILLLVLGAALGVSLAVIGISSQ
ncbi:MAG TPA: UbiA family prenyltransferase [Methylocella sp.]|jgi:4-hydroxybenzoate polyprenyltransferase/phosphoserine phosphatase